MSDKSWDEVLEREGRKSASADYRLSPAHAVEGDATLPSLDDPYKAMGPPSNGREETLCCILGNKELAAGEPVYRFFQYVHLDSNTGLAFAKDGQVMRLRFIGDDPATITVRGRNLLRACHLIHKHRIGWIRLFDRERSFSFLEEEKGKKTEIITSIEITDGRKSGPPGAG